MRKDKKLQDKREAFVINYIHENKNKQMKIIMNDLSERLFLSERTIYMIYAKYHNDKKKAKELSLNYNLMIMSFCRSLFTGPIDENDFKECGDYMLEVTWHPFRQLQYYELSYNGNYILWFNYSNETNTFDEKIPNTPKGSKSIELLYNEISKLKFI